MKSCVLAVFVLLLVRWSTIATASADPLTVSITVEGTHPPGFTSGSPTEYRAASGSYTFTCTATGGAGSGAYDYVWTSTCAECNFQRSSTGAASEIHRTSLHSGDNGIHTCTATRGGESGSDDFVITIVGAGMFVFHGFGVTGAQPNNGLVISNDPGSGFRFRFFCRSNSSTHGVGELIGLDESPVTDGSTFGFETPNNGGELRVENIVGTHSVLTASEQGVYTCRIPLEGGEMRELNIGVYPSGFNTIPSIINPLLFTLGSSSSTLTCISTGSVATTVTFIRNGTTVGPLRDGESMEFGGVTYLLTQMVTNRAQSTYQNVLTINQPLAEIIGSAFSCSVANIIGTSSTSQPFIITRKDVPPPPSATIVAVSSTAIKISWEDDFQRYGVISCTVSYERATGDMQQGPCHLTGHSNNLTFASHDMETAIIVTGLEEFSTYTVKIKTRNEVGCSSPSTWKVTTWPAAPSSAPEWVNSTATTSTTITVQWGAVPCMDQNSEITAYKVQYGPVDSSHKTTDTVTGSASTGGMHTMIGLIPSTNYSIEVAAVNRSGDVGPFTPSIITATTSITSSPRIISLKASNATAILVTWMVLELPGWNVSQYTVYHTTVPRIQGRSDDEHEFPGNATSGIVPISGVTPDHTHQFQVSGSLTIEGVIYEGPRSENRSIIFNLNVSINVTYNPPNDSIWLHQNDEYRAASGPLVATCRVQGTSGAVTFQWSSTCRDCPFQSTKPHSTRSVLVRAALHSGDTGTHTCTVNDNQGRAGIASIVMNIKGAGIHVFNGGPYKQSTSLSNNGLVVSLDEQRRYYRFRFFCRSDSMEENVGMLIGLDGRTAVTTNSYFNIDNPQPGELTVNNTVDHETPFPASEQGVYTCRIPLESGEQREINIGVYPIGFSSGPSITDCLVLSPGSPSSTLTCTSTGSPATTVTWMKDGNPLTIDGTSYKLAQTVINRAESTYENVLTINDLLNNTFHHTYTCNVTNVLGDDLRDLITMAPPVPDCFAEGSSSTSIKLSWRRPPECRVDFFRITWATATTQLLPCPKYGEKRAADVGSDITEYILTELEIFHTYSITITAMNAIGNSTCNQDITTLPAPPSSAPEWINSGEITSTSITVQWGAVPCMNQNSYIVGYKIRYGPVGSSQSTTITATGSASSGGMYTLIGLIPFTNYSIEVTAVNSNGDEGPFTLPYFAETLIPTPANVNFEVLNATAVKLSWTKSQLAHLNLSHSTVYYTATKQGRVIDQFHINTTTPSVVVVMRNLMSGLVHQFQVSCSLRDTTRGLLEGPRSTNRRFSFDEELFQLQIGPVEHCITWQPEKAEKVDTIIHRELIEPISCQCNCTFPDGFIRRGKFSCRNTTATVSYRSTIVGTNTYNASQLVNIIQQWVSSGPILEVEWWLLDVYADCPARISSLNDPECQNSEHSDGC